MLEVEGLGKEREGAATASREGGATPMVGHAQSPDNGEVGGCSTDVRDALCFRLSPGRLTNINRGGDGSARERGRGRRRRGKGNKRCDY